MTQTTRDGENYDIVREGLAEILTPKQPLKDDGRTEGSHERTKVQDVFYNPVQQFNRDLTVLAIRAFGEDLAAIRGASQKKRNPSAKGESKRHKRKEAVVNEGIQEAERATNINETIVKSISGNGTESKVLIAEQDVEGPPKGTESTSIGRHKRKRGLKSNGTSEFSQVSKKSRAIIETASGDRKPVASKTAHEEVQISSTGVEPVETPLHSGTGDPNPPDETTSSSKFPFRILDALSATGLRAIRYAKEIPETTKVVANDLSGQATASIRLNVLHNEVPNKINVLTGDARAHMYQVAAPAQGSTKGEHQLYEVIDLDPYGTAAPFLDAAVRAVVDGGLLCVTCTDATVFASVGYLEKTFSQYGGLPWRGPQSHEGGLRLVLHAIAACAARYGISIEPLLSLSIDFYVRVFVRVHRSPAQVKFLAGKSMVVYNCDVGCGAWNTQFLAQTRAQTAKDGNTIHKFSFAQAPSTGPFCEHCGFKTHLSGPMWGGPLHNPFFIQRILDALPSLKPETYGTIPRIEGMLSVAYQESIFAIQPKNSLEPDKITRPVPPTDPTLRDHHPFFFNLSSLAKVLHCVGPSDAIFCGALNRLGYRTSRSHTRAGSIRTDAPWSVVWEVMREWIRQKAPIKENAIRKGTAGWAIMQKDRSNVMFNSVKTSLKQIQEKSENVHSLRIELEAILYRLREEEEEATAAAAVAAAHPPHRLTDQQQPNLENQSSTPPSSSTDSSPPRLPPSSLTEPSPVPKSPTPALTPTPTPTHQLDVVFDMHRRARSPSPARKIVRYQLNPRPDWGPMCRAKGG